MMWNWKRRVSGFSTPIYHKKFVSCPQLSLFVSGSSCQETKPQFHQLHFVTIGTKYILAHLHSAQTLLISFQVPKTSNSKPNDRLCHHHHPFSHVPDNSHDPYNNVPDEWHDGVEHCHGISTHNKALKESEPSAGFYDSEEGVEPGSKGTYEILVSVFERNSKERKKILPALTPAAVHPKIFKKQANSKMSSQVMMGGTKTRRPARSTICKTCSIVQY